MKIKLKLFFVIYVLIFFDITVLALENKIILRVNNEIITSIDIYNEIKYLTTLNPGINKLKEIEVYEISKKSLIKEKIKENEIQKNFVNTSLPEELLEQLIFNVYSKIGIISLDEFKIYLINPIQFSSHIRCLGCTVFYGGIFKSYFFYRLTDFLIFLFKIFCILNFKEYL